MLLETTVLLDLSTGRTGRDSVWRTYSCRSSSAQPRSYTCQAWASSSEMPKWTTNEPAHLAPYSSGTRCQACAQKATAQQREGQRETPCLAEAHSSGGRVDPLLPVGETNSRWLVGVNLWRLNASALSTSAQRFDIYQRSANEWRIHEATSYRKMAATGCLRRGPDRKTETLTSPSSGAMAC